MANELTYGLSMIKMGAIAGDGGMGTSLTQIGYTKPGSCTFVAEDPTETEIRAEEEDDPLDVVYRGGKAVLSFTLQTPDPAQFASVMGGTVSGTSSELYDAPRTFSAINRSVQVVPKTGKTLNIVNGKVTAKVNATFSNEGTDIFTIDVRVVAQTPTKDTIGPWNLS